MSIPRIRLIIMSTANGEEESVIFTEDFDTEADDYCARGQTVDLDEQVLVELPDGFPLDYTLDRRQPF